MEETPMTRKYPSYTTQELESFVASGRGNDSIVQEIADRKSGASMIRLTPQIMSGKVVTKIGRL
jgi:hypothetical protein